MTANTPARESSNNPHVEPSHACSLHVGSSPQCPPESSSEFSTSVSPRTTYSSYKEYIDRNVELWPELRWMQLFVEHDRLHPSGTLVNIFDSRDGDSLLEKTFNSEDLTGFQEVVEGRLRETNTRIIVVTYRETWGIDRRVVDILGLAF